jgi:hypothetical protein
VHPVALPMTVRWSNDHDDGQQLRLFDMPFLVEQPEGPCSDCGIPTAPRRGPREWYMVTDEVWAAAGMRPGAVVDGALCIGCLERRLGRRLTSADFLDLPVNHDPEWLLTPRLIDRLGLPPEGDRRRPGRPPR